jgi:hypothetical protein
LVVPAFGQGVPQPARTPVRTRATSAPRGAERGGNTAAERAWKMQVDQIPPAAFTEDADIRIASPLRMVDDSNANVQPSQKGLTVC